MRVAIDVSSAARAERSGVARYVSELVRAFAHGGHDHEFLLCYRLSRMRSRRHWLGAKAANTGTRILWPWGNPVLRRRADVFFGPDARLAPDRYEVEIATIHDVFSLVSDDYASPEFRELKIRRYHELARRATRIVTDSQRTAADLVDLVGVSPEILRTVPLGVSTDFRPRPRDEVEAVKARRGIPCDGEYALYVGNLNNRKNLPMLINAFSASARRLPPRSHLVLAGAPTFGGREVVEAKAKSGVGDRIVLTGYVASAEIPALYSGARIFCFPSLYEGFGLPPLEAMACGTPTLVSRAAAIPETCDDASLYAEPEDSEAWSESLVQLWEDESLRETLRERGRARAGLFTWERTATMMLDVFGECAG